jgi:hypothetical protein
VANDCRNCKHNTYGGSPLIADWVACSHPITISKRSKSEPGDPAFVSLSGTDLRVQDMPTYLRDCPTWEPQP